MECLPIVCVDTCALCKGAYEIIMFDQINYLIITFNLTQKDESKSQKFKMAATIIDNPS